MALPGTSSLQDIAAKLAIEGPVKQEPSKRRVRGLVGGEWVFDTLGAFYVWEHPYFPFFYVPLAAIEAGPGHITKGSSPSEGYWLGKLDVAGKVIDIAGFDAGPLQGLVKIPHTSLDAWFAEDEKLLGTHPKDPYKRIECLPSSRELRIEVNGVVLAKSTNNVFLYETGLRTRYYLTPTSISDWSILLPSAMSTVCPYKGQASYYHVKVGETVIEDAIWYYTYPTAESAQVQNRLCFYNEKVDVFIDGVKEA